MRWCRSDVRTTRSRAAEHRSTKHAVELAAQFHRQRVTAHPLIDGNGRTASLVVNLLLLRAGSLIFGRSGGI